MFQLLLHQTDVPAILAHPTDLVMPMIKNRNIHSDFPATAPTAVVSSCSYQLDGTRRCNRGHALAGRYQH